MKEKLNQGEYRTWDYFKADLDLMFTNAKTYNPIMHPVWKTVSSRSMLALVVLQGSMVVWFACLFARV